MGSNDVYATTKHTVSYYYYFLYNKRKFKEEELYLAVREAEPGVLDHDTLAAYGTRDPRVLLQILDLFHERTKDANP